MKPRFLIVPFSLAAIAAPVFAELGPEARPKVIYTPIVLSGQNAPGGGTFTAFPYHSVIDDAQHIVFMGATNGSPWSPDGIFLSSSNGIDLVAKTGAQAPGFAPGVSIIAFDVNYHRSN